MPASTLKDSIALLYKKKGRDQVSRKDLELMITMDFRWFSPTEAASLIDLAITSGILKKKKDMLEITFDWRTHEVTIGFKPTEKVFEDVAHRSCFLAIVDAIEKETGRSRSEIVAEINKKQEKLNVAIEIAALLIGATYGLDISVFYEIVEKELMSRFGQPAA